MADYEKVTPAKFRTRLKDGQYKNLTGARRAIGRMSEWSDGQKNRARGDSDRHFEGGGASSDKASKKKATKKAGKKAIKSVAKKKSSKKAVTKTAAKTKSKGGALVRQQSRNKRKSNESSPAQQMTNVQEANLKVGTITQALQAMSTAKELGASETDVAKGAKRAQQALTQIVEELCGAVAQTPLSEEEQEQAETLAKAAAASAGANGTAPASSPGLSSPTTPAVPTQPVETA